MVGRIALVTGAGGDFGQAIARSLGEAGHRVVLAGRGANVAEAAEELRGDGYDALAETLNVADAASIAEVVGRLIAAHGRIDILVNNAGIGVSRRGPDGGVLPTAEMTDAEWASVVAVNLTGPFLLSRALVPAMRAGGWGRIINISSRAGRTAVAAGDIAYASTKAGLIGMTRRLAAEVAADGVTVNAIAPGRFEAGMAKLSSPAVAAVAMASIPMGRGGRVEEIGGTVRFLASDDAGYITGAVLDVNGGGFMGG